MTTGHDNLEPPVMTKWAPEETDTSMGRPTVE